MYNPNGGGELKFAPIQGYEGKYLISECGRVYSLIKNKFLKPSDNGNGYLKVTLCKDGSNHWQVYIHRLVVDAFCDNADSHECINHIDGNKKNNNFKNLEWCTQSHNNKHAYDNGLKSAYWTGRKAHNRRPVIKMDVKGNEIRRFDNISAAAIDTYGYPEGRSLIANVCNGKTKTAGGHIWKYANS